MSEDQAAPTPEEIDAHFDWNFEDLKDPREPVPAGLYDLEVTPKAGIAPNKSGRQMATVPMTVQHENPEYNGKSVTTYHVLEGDEQWVKNHQWELRELLEAAGVPTNLKPSAAMAMLQGKRIRAMLAVEPATEQYGASNSVQKVLPRAE